MADEHELETVLHSALDGSGVVLDGVTITPAGRRRVVKVVVDSVLSDDQGSAEAGPAPSLTLDEIAAATRTINQALDTSDVLGEQPYTLEVTSPGVSRPLTRPEHFRRNASRLVEITRVDGPPLTARIHHADDREVTVVVPASGKTPEAEHTLPYAAISRAVVQIEFSRPDPAAGGSTSRPSKEN